MTSDGAGTVTRDLNALLGSRICHDLISPLGAIGNGVELLSMTEQGSSPELALISDSIESANACIRFFRIAFGAAPESSVISLAEIRSVLADVAKGSRITMAWEAESDLSRARVKLAFLLILCLENAMPFGGHIRLRAERGTNWTLTGSAERLKVDDRLWNMMRDPRFDTDVTPRDVQFALVQDAATRCGTQVDTQIRESLVTIRF